ncbi:MAG: hypothetical protein AAF483_28490 [Planctomycetota bacterium]
METVYKDYASEDVKFYYIYKALAHPENNGYVAPFSLKERLMHVAEAKRTLKTEIPWICDSMENDLKHALGDRPNSEFVVGPDGEVIIARQWSNPELLREDLAKLLGRSSTRTQVSDLDMRGPPPPEKAPTGIVPRVQTPGQMQPLIVEPQPSSASHYVKLRAEMARGQLYLGFFLDPLYKVHWNNEAPALQFEIEAPSGIRLETSKGSGPEVDAKADADPREFLIPYNGNSNQPLRVKVSYFACDDAETFCNRVEQEYLVTLERDRDGGSRRAAGGRSRGRPGGQGGNGFGPSGGRGNPGPRTRGNPGAQMQQMLLRMPIYQVLDANGDGELSEAEIKAAPSKLKQLDRNRDGKISGQEFRPGR